MAPPRARATRRRGPRVPATRRSGPTSPAAGPASIASSTAPPAADRTATSSMRSGTSSGPARSRTTRSPRCARCAGRARRRRTARPRPGRLTALGPPEAAGRWSLVEDGPAAGSPTAGPAARTERMHALALALLERHGVLTREAVAAEAVAGGFSAVYPVLRAMEEAGRIRRGYFVDGLGAAQFAQAGALDRLRAVREPAGASGSAEPRIHLLAAADPANPYGAALAWPRRERRRSPAAPACRGRVCRPRRRPRSRSTSNEADPGSRRSRPRTTRSSELGRCAPWARSSPTVASASWSSPRSTASRSPVRHGASGCSRPGSCPATAGSPSARRAGRAPTR